MLSQETQRKSWTNLLDSLVTAAERLVHKLSPQTLVCIAPFFRIAAILETHGVGSNDLHRGKFLYKVDSCFDNEIAIVIWFPVYFPLLFFLFCLIPLLPREDHYCGPSQCLEPRGGYERLEEIVSSKHFMCVGGKGLVRPCPGEAVPCPVHPP